MVDSRFHHLLMNISHRRRKPISVAYDRRRQSSLFGDLFLGKPEPEVSARKLAARLRNPRFEPEGSLAERSRFKMESVTKWEWGSPRTYHSVEPDEKLVEDEPASNVVSSLRSELWKAQLRIEELENQKISSEKEIQRLIATEQGRNREEHEGDPLVDYLRKKLTHERRKRRRAEALNTRLLKKISDSESLMKRRAREREVIEEVCEELLGRIETLTAKTNRIRDETEEERQMLQMAEVWREERVKMKLVDAKLALQEKYEEMDQIVSEFEKFLEVKRDGIGEKSLRRAEELMEMVRSVNVSDQIQFEHFKFCV